MGKNIPLYRYIYICKHTYFIQIWIKMVFSGIAENAPLFHKIFQYSLVIKIQ